MCTNCKIRMHIFDWGILYQSLSKRILFFFKQKEEKNKQLPVWTWQCSFACCAPYTNHIEYVEGKRNMWNLWKAPTFIAFYVLMPNNLCSATANFIFLSFPLLTGSIVRPNPKLTDGNSHKRKWKIGEQTHREWKRICKHAATAGVHNQVTALCVRAVRSMFWCLS